MKKLFTFLFALIASVGMVFAAKDVVPSDAVLANYYEAGQLCVCIFVPAEMACNDVVFVGTYNRDASDAWITDVKKLAKFQPVEGYDGWYVVAVNDETPADFQDKGIQGKPVVLDQDGNFDWQYQVRDVTVIRGGVTVVAGFAGEIDLVGYTKDAPNIFIINALKANANPCTAVYHNYTITVISDGCEGFAVPYLIGSMTDWGFQQMQLDVEATMANNAPTYFYKCKCAEGTRYQILSCLMANDGSIAEYPTWDATSYLEQLVDDVWVRYTENGNVDLTTGDNVNITFDVRQKNLRWARCAAPEDAYEVAVSLTAPAGAPAAGVEIIGDFDGWAGTPMTLENGKYTATVSATPSQKFKFREAGTWDNEIMIADAGAEGGWKGFPTTQFQSVWEPAAEEGKMVINLDLSNPTMYRWKEIQTITGTCGDNLTWTLVDSVLTISGTGAMADYAYASKTPWYEYRSSILSVVISDGVTSIGDYAFSGCTSLTSVTIGNSVTSIGRGAFFGCSSLTSVTIGNSVTSIGEGAFRECTSLTSITIPNSVTSIGKYAFYGCTSLTSVTIPNSVTSIGDDAFEACYSLTSVSIGNRVTSIGEGAFSDCTKLSSVIIPKSVVSIGEDVFGGSYLLSSISVEAGNPVYDSRDNCNAIIETTTNTIIAGCPNTIIPNSVTAIGNYAFAGFISITSFDIPNQIVKIGNSAFGGCENLSSVRIPNSVISIGEDAFSNCSSLTTITIPSSVKEIMRDAFWRCSSMSAINFESQIPPTMGVSMFYMNDCSFYVPCGTKDAYVAALNVNNTIDESRVIEKTFIASGYCGVDSTNLTWELSCDSILTISGTGAMADYTSASNVPWYRYRSDITTLLINDGVTSIGRDAFLDCSSLTSITIPNSVTSIGKGAFISCSSLTSVTIPNSVTSIGNYAFYGCSSLTSVTFEGSTPPVFSENVFYFAKECPIYVPCGTKDAYVAALNVNNTIDESRVKEPVIASGTCGDNLTWELSCNSVLTVSGTGAMADYPFATITMPWRDYRSSIKTVAISDGVTSIGFLAFYGCTSLTSVTIGNSVTSIGSEAFSGCSSLTSVTIPNSVTSIGEWAFAGCSKLTSVTINSDAIVNKAYTSDYNLSHIFGSQVTEYIIGDNVKGIGDCAFYTCSSLTSVTIGNSVTSIGDCAFGYCSSLTSVTIPNSVTWIGVRAFLDCSSLTSITIPNSVTSIGEDAFFYCSSLTSITIPNSVTEVGGGMFYGCSNLESIVLSENITELQASYLKYGGGILNYGFFEGCSSLTSITIPESVTSIGNEAFYDCSSLTSVTINSDAIVNQEYTSSDNLSDIFGSQVTKYIIGDNVKGIGDYAFYGCSSLTSITIPNSVTSIGEYAFYKCYKLTSITIPNSIASIGDYAFGYCSSLTSITIPNSVTSIGDQAFSGCSSLTSINVDLNNPNCSSVDGVLFNKDKTMLIQYPIGNTRSEYTIPNSVTSIGNYAFKSCSSLTSVTIPNSVTSIGEDAFYDCSSLTYVTIPNSVTSIGDGAFYDCYSLASVTIGNSVTSIGEYAFAWCSSLTSVTIPNSVTSIGDYAFSGCDKLVDVYCYATTPPVTRGENTFSRYNAFLYVPCESKKAYMVDAVWGNFKYIECISSDNVTTDEIVVTPSENEANVIWPTVSGAASYELVIKDKSGNIVCTLIFNANGQLTSIAFNAPSHNGAPAQTQSAGFSFTITGLDSSTGYDLTLTAKDNSGNAIQTETISFITTGGNVSTDIDQLQGHKVQSTKVVKDGQVLILRNGKTYTIQGQEVK